MYLLAGFILSILIILFLLREKHISFREYFFEILIIICLTTFLWWVILVMFFIFIYTKIKGFINIILGV